MKSTARIAIHVISILLPDCNYNNNNDNNSNDNSCNDDDDDNDK